MIHLTIHPDLLVSPFNTFEDLGITTPNDERILKPREDGAGLEVGGLAVGTQGGKPTVMLVTELEDGNVVILETTLALFLTAGDALKARHGDPRIDNPTTEEPPQ